jgi:hypothetical protein
LWKALRERGREENAYQTGDLDSRELSLELLSSLLGIDGYLD